MSTLLLRLSGPMQSWGTSSRFDARATTFEPSRSGVIGLVANALGRTRDEDIGSLASLRMGVRVDRPGSILRDFQTIQPIGPDGVRRDGGGTITSPRLYLSHAEFVVGLEHADRSLLQSLADRLFRPARVLSLGRRSCLPGEPVVADPASAVVDLPLDAALLVAPDRPRSAVPLRERRRFVVEDPDNTPDLGSPDLVEARYDRPEGAAYASTRRAVGHRRLVGIYTRVPHAPPADLPKED